MPTGVYRIEASIDDDGFDPPFTIEMLSPNGGSVLFALGVPEPGTLAVLTPRYGRRK